MNKKPCRPEADRAMVLVTGAVRFTDWPLLRRKMNALTAGLVSPVIATTAQPGAEEFAEAWALSRWFTVVKFHEGMDAAVRHALTRRRAFAVVFDNGRENDTRRAVALLKRSKLELRIIKV